MNMHTPTATAAPPLVRVLPYGGMLDEEVADISKEMLASVPEQAWTGADGDIEQAGLDAVSATRTWLAMYERPEGTGDVHFGLTFDARVRMQDCHRYYADLLTIAGLGCIGKGWMLRPDAPGWYALAEDGADDKVTLVPSGLPASAYRALVDTYVIGMTHGRQALQREMRTLLGGV